MTNKEITSVALKVFAIYVLVQAILSIPLLVNAAATYGFSENQNNSSLLLWFLGAIAFILLVVLTVFAWKLAIKIATHSSAHIEERETFEVDESFFISLLGLYLLFEGILRFGYACISAFMLVHEGSELSVQTMSYVIGYLLQLIIGLTLVLKAHGWMRFLRWLRVAGLKGKF
ncbi:MAG: hypothetical protein AB2784_21965 [Candidatus Thiodiazotropha endolucinida]